MTDKEELKAFFAQWKVLEGKPAKYHRNEFYEFLEFIRPGDAEGLYSFFLGKGLIRSDVKGNIYLTDYGMGFFPKDRLEQAEGVTKENIVSTEAEWHEFRNLLRYYIECVKSEDRKEYHLNVEQEGRQFFIPSHVPVNWFESDESGKRAEFIVSLHDAEIGMLGAFANGSEVCIGYPIEARFNRDGQAYEYVPLFLIPIKTEKYISSGTNFRSGFRFLIKPLFEQATYNIEWITRNCDISLLDEMLDIIEDENGINLNTALKCIIGYSRYSKRIGEFDPDRLVQMLPTISRKGQRRKLCNTVALFRLQNTAFNDGLIRELEMIEKAEPAELDCSALAYIYRKHPLKNSNDTNPVAIPFLTSNSEQLEAVERAFSNHISVLQGPPGTGKSQVAVNLIANCVFNGRSVLFASRNHAAIEAIRDRANALINSTGSPALVKFCKEADGTINNWFSTDLKSARDEVLSVKMSFGESSARILSDSMSAISEIKKYYENENKVLSDYLSVENKYEASINHIRSLLVHADASVPLQEILDCADVIHLSVSKGIKGFIYRLAHKKEIESAKHVLIDQYHVCPSYQIDAEKSLADLCKALCREAKAYKTAKTASDAAYKQYRAKIKGSDYSAKYNSAMDHMASNARQGLLYNWVNEIQKLTKEDYSFLEKQLTFAMKKSKGKLCDEDIAANVRANQLLHAIEPAWAVSLLSARHSSPLSAGIFDMVIIDEASQCDCISIIPVLFRAKNAVVIGDPEQFRPIIKMSKRRHDYIWGRYFSDKSENLKYEYRSNSAYSIVSKFAAPGMLKEHFRCDNDIASFINEAFYNGQLRIRTNELPLNYPKIFENGDHLRWIEVNSGIESEIETCIRTLKEIKAGGFSGSIGIVTPLRNNADRLANAIYGAGYKTEEIKVNTAYGFQGGECDVIIFVLGYDAELNSKQLWYLTDSSNKNIFDVSLSRAKACLLIIGNRDKCRTSSSHVLRILAEYPKKAVEEFNMFESPWEERLFNALQKAGIKTTPQYYFHGYQFDLAYIDEYVKLDIEVDGYKYHFNMDGTRKTSDFRRDAAVESYGWKPLRFVVKELNEDMDLCVDRIKSEINHARNSMHKIDAELIAMDPKNILGQVFRLNPTTAEVERDYRIGNVLVDYAYENSAIKIAVQIVNSKNAAESLNVKNYLTKKGWDVFIVAEKDIIVDASSIAMAISARIDDCSDIKSGAGYSDDADTGECFYT